MEDSLQTLTMNGAMTSPEVLNSWKEIATYVGRGVRTVQRWEAESGFPVRRPGRKSRSSVIALRSEIDGWFKACPLEAKDLREAPQDSSEVPQDCLGETQLIRLATRELVSASRQLRQQVMHSRRELHSSLNEFVSSLEKLVTASRYEDKSLLVLDSSAASATPA